MQGQRNPRWADFPTQREKHSSEGRELWAWKQEAVSSGVSAQALGLLTTVHVVGVSLGVALASE